MSGKLLTIFITSMWPIALLMNVGHLYGNPAIHCNMKEMYDTTQDICGYYSKN